MVCPEELTLLFYLNSSNLIEFRPNNAKSIKAKQQEVAMKHFPLVQVFVHLE